MMQIVDSHVFSPRDRVEAIMHLARTIVPVEIAFPENGPTVRGSVTDLGSIRLTSIRSNATRVERTPRHARDDFPPSLMLGLQTTGSSLVVQDGREAVVRPGDVVLYRSTSPYTLVDGDGYRQHQLRMPLDGLALPGEVVRRLTATRLSPGHPVSDLAYTYFQRLAARQRELTEAEAGSVGRPGLELIRAVISTHLDSDVVESQQATLLLRILEYVRAQLGDPTLNATRIAAEHHISVRHLYNVLAAGDISLGDWIRQRRLEGCRAELARPHARGVTIASVAQRWGFRDASNFGRVFRAEYGVSPSEWRASAGTDQPG
jgi:AraC-like DNA-binding protein